MIGITALMGSALLFGSLILQGLPDGSWRWSALGRRHER